MQISFHGYGTFVWSVYGITSLVFCLYAIAAVRQAKRVKQAIRRRLKNNNEC